MTSTEEALIGITTREITMSANKGRDIKRFPAGTEVYVTHTEGNGTCLIRVPWSLYTQRVNLFRDIEPA